MATKLANRNLYASRKRRNRKVSSPEELVDDIDDENSVKDNSDIDAMKGDR